MVQVILIALFATLHLFEALVGEPALQLSTVQVVALTLLPIIAAWVAFQVLALWWGSQIDSGRRQSIAGADTAMLGLTLVTGAWWAFGVFGLGALTAVRRLLGDVVLLDEIVTIAPVLLFAVATWWSMYPLEIRLRNAILLRQLDNADGFPIHPPLTRGQYVIAQVRHQMLLFLVPLSLMTGWREAVDLWIAPWLLESWPQLPRQYVSVIEYVGLVSMLIISPALMKSIWDTVPIGDGAVRDQVQAMCRRYRVRVRGPLLWRTHGSMVNGAILGILWPFRYMLLSDALLERLTADEVEAVMAHEVAHVRRKHLIWLAVCIISTASVMVWALTGILDGLPLASLSPSTLSALMALAGLVGAGTVFGLVSRRFEWQADAFAVQHLTRTSKGVDGLPPNVVTPYAINAMAGALRSVAFLNGIDPNRFTWRHGSVAERIHRLGRLEGEPVGSLPIDRQVAIIKVVAVVALVASMYLQSNGAAS